VHIGVTYPGITRVEDLRVLHTRVYLRVEVLRALHTRVYLRFEEHAAQSATPLP